MQPLVVSRIFRRELHLADLVLRLFSSDEAGYLRNQANMVNMGKYPRTQETVRQCQKNFNLGITVYKF